MTRAIRARVVSDALAAEGLLPPGCARVELLLPPDGALMLRYELLVGGSDLAKLARALQVISEQIAAEPAPGEIVEVFSRPECPFQYCDAPDVCQPAGACRHAVRREGSR